MTNRPLEFKKNKSDQEINDIYNFNVQAFADVQGVAWSLESIKKEIKEGWELYSANIEEDIVAVIFMKKDGDKILTKNTPIKMSYQGNGFSHMIKDFYEEKAREFGIKKILNYCPSDNFRMIALNEGHAYKRTGKLTKDKPEMIEWEKNLKS